MHTYYDAKDMLHDELAEIVKKGELSAGTLDTVDKLLHSIKNADKIIMYEEYANDGYSYADADTDATMYANARGRGTSAPRDARGRYSTARGTRTRYNRNYGYSYGDDMHEKIELLHEMKDNAQTDDEKRTIEKIIRRMEMG